MPRRCVAMHCSHSVSKLFQWPKDEDLAKKWTKFVKAKRVNFTPIATSVLCYKHFTDDCFANSMEYDHGFSRRLMLVADAVPTIQLRPSPSPTHRDQGAHLSQPTPRAAAAKRERKRLVALAVSSLQEAVS